MDAAPRNEFQKFIPASLRAMNTKSSNGNKATLNNNMNNNNDFELPNYNKAKDTKDTSPLIMRTTTIGEERNH